jgi:hydroxymethylglutaryl-CoA reductase (NADPH)
VIAEATISSEILESKLGVSAQMLFKMRQISNMGSFMAGSINNGSHSANGITAMFIACGQDAANVAESSAALSFVDVDEQGNFYIAITLPSLIVATFGGGTALATQKECLEMMDCFGEGKAHKLAEIIGATVLAGELSLSAAVLAGDWVTSHDALGRNR